MVDDYWHNKHFPAIRQWCVQFENDKNASGDCARDILADRDFPHTHDHKKALNYLETSHKPIPRIWKQLKQFLARYNTEKLLFERCKAKAPLFSTEMTKIKEIADLARTLSRVIPNTGQITIGLQDDDGNFLGCISVSKKDSQFVNLVRLITKEVLDRSEKFVRALAIAIADLRK